MVARDDEDADAGCLDLCELIDDILVALVLGIFRQVARDEQQLGLIGLDALNEQVEDGNAQLLHLLVLGEVGLPGGIFLTVEQRGCHHVDVGQDVDLLVGKAP